jgi:hypothetical protein
MSGAADTTSTIIPCLRYRDAHAAIDWLCKAFGFEKHAVYEGTDGGIDHAQLVFGNGMVMLSSRVMTTSAGCSHRWKIPPAAKPNALASSSPIRGNTTNARRQRAPRSSSISPNRVTAEPATAAATPKAITGGSAATTPGARDRVARAARRSTTG